MMNSELNSLQIDRSANYATRNSSRMRRWIALSVTLLLLSGTAAFVHADLTAAVEVKTVRARLAFAANESKAEVTLNTTGYIVSAHKIEVASKVAGKVAWTGVKKGDRVKQGQELVRLEDEEYRARVTEAQGALAALKARLLQLQNGSRPEEIAKANADLAQIQAELDNAKISLNRTRLLVQEGLQPKQMLDDAEARYKAQAARVVSSQQAYELVRLGPREEEKAVLQAQIKQAEGTLQFAQNQLENTIIRAPVTGTVLERNVERGEFVTNGFVGEHGAKGYVVTLANLSELEVELDIAQDDFARLKPRQRAIITTDAYPDRQHQGVLDEISPEANRQNATVQVKVRVLNPNEFLRPEINANVTFFTRNKAASGEQLLAEALPAIPASAVRDDAVFVVIAGKAVRRKVQTGATTPQGVQITKGVSSGEDVIVNPPANLQDGQKVRVKEEKKQ
jgi:HlyD family secretion protein